VSSIFHVDASFVPLKGLVYQTDLKLKLENGLSIVYDKINRYAHTF